MMKFLKRGILTALILTLCISSFVSAAGLTVRIEREEIDSEAVQYVVVTGKLTNYKQGEPVFLKVYDKSLSENTMKITDYAALSQLDSINADGTFEIKEEFFAAAKEYKFTVTSEKEVLSEEAYISSLDAINTLIEKLNKKEITAAEVVSLIAINNKDLAFDTTIYDDISDAAKQQVIADMISENGTAFDITNIYESFNRYALINALEYGTDASEAYNALYYYNDKYLNLEEMSIKALADSFGETKMNIVYELMNGEEYSEISDIRERYFEAVILTGVKEAVSYSNIYDILDTYKNELGINNQVSYLAGTTKNTVLLYLVDQKNSITSIENLIDKIDYALNNLNVIAGNYVGGKVSSGGGGGGGVSTVVESDPPVYSETAPSLSAGSGLNDLSSVPWAASAITTLYNKGIVSGKAPEIYAPNDNITRAEIVKMLVMAFNEYNSNLTSGFYDLQNHWANSYVASAYNRGYVIGRSDTEFGADYYITREDTAVILYRMMQVNDKTVTVTNITKKFTDHNDISDYAVRGVEMLSEYKIINGFDDGSFKPQNLLTRAEAAVLIKNFLDYVNK